MFVALGLVELLYGLELGLFLKLGWIGINLLLGFVRSPKTWHYPLGDWVESISLEPNFSCLFALDQLHHAF